LLAVYPNPISSSLNLRLECRVELLSYTVLDVYGKKVIEGGFTNKTIAVN